MQYQKLGKSDLNVSQFALGCMGFGKVREVAVTSMTVHGQ